MNIVTAPTAAPATPPDIIGYANGTVISHRASEKGTGTVLSVEIVGISQPVSVYVKADRELPADGSIAKFVAMRDPGRATPTIRLAGELSLTEVQAAFK